MNSHTKLLRMVFMGMMIALGVVISPILRVEGMCPMAHLINITCAVMLGPLEAFICAFLIGIIRMALMGIPPLALTGAIFGAALSGILYRASKGKIAFAWGKSSVPASSAPSSPILSWHCSGGAAASPGCSMCRPLLPEPSSAAPSPLSC